MGTLNERARARLLQIARLALEERVLHRRFLPPLVEPEDLHRPGAAFVTLTKEGEARGCVGYIEPVRPLADTVAACAAAAAVDPRFPPVGAEELTHLTIEISVLSPMTPIGGADEIRVGTHGLLVRRGAHLGIILPQVAVEQGWDGETFLRTTCLKASLPPSAWRESAELYVFTAEVFREATSPGGPE